MPMQVAQFLSDLNSLLICENQAAALALVSAKIPKDETLAKQNDTPDLARAYQLIALHKEVKQAYAPSGEGHPRASLNEARESVRKAVVSLGGAGVGIGVGGDGIVEDAIIEEDEGEGEINDDEIAAWS